jgi:hypothetical protein
MSTTFDLKKKLFMGSSSDAKEIAVLGAAAKSIGSSGPAGLGYSKSRTSSVKTPAKYSGIATAR